MPGNNSQVKCSHYNENMPVNSHVKGVHAQPCYNTMQSTNSDQQQQHLNRQNSDKLNKLSSSQHILITNDDNNNDGSDKQEQVKEESLSLVERLGKRIPGFGIILAVMASFFLGSAGLLVKLTDSVHGIQVAVFR